MHSCPFCFLFCLATQYILYLVACFAVLSLFYDAFSHNFSRQDDDEKRKRIAEKLAAKQAAIEQAAPAPASIDINPAISAPAIVVSQPLGAVATPPVIVTSQPLGFTGVPVMNFGSMFPQSNPFPALAPGDTCIPLRDSFSCQRFDVWPFCLVFS
jgi:hypothetical protein